MRQTILWSTIHWYWLKPSSRKFPGQNTDLFFWINKVSDVSFSNSEQACLRCAGLHAALHLSFGSYHTETHHLKSPLLFRIKIIIVTFLLKLTTLTIQSDCFSIKRSRQRPTDRSLQLTLPIYYHTWRWNAIKDSKFQPSLVDKKVFKMWVLLGTSQPVQYSWLHFAGVRYIPKNLEHSWPCCGSLNTLWWED